PMQTFEIPSRLAVTVLEPDTEPLFPLDQIKRLRPRFDFGRLPLLIRDKIDRRRDALPIGLRFDAFFHLQDRLALLEFDLASFSLFKVIRQPNIKLLPRPDRIDSFL